MVTATGLRCARRSKSHPRSALSGGERNRLLLARLFAQPANLLVMDEPTNDLDIDSLELLETTLQSYDGTLLLVSHDRAFLDNVVTQTLVAEGDGHWREYVGGYSDWVAQRARAEGAVAGGIEGKAGGKTGATTAAAATAATAPSGATAAKGGGAGGKDGGAGAAPARAKLSFKEQRELAALPAELEALENEQHALTALMSSADYHKRGADAIKADRARAEAIEHLLAAKFERWAELEARAAPAGR